MLDPSLRLLGEREVWDLDVLRELCAKHRGALPVFSDAEEKTQLSPEKQPNVLESASSPAAGGSTLRCQAYYQSTKSLSLA